MRKTTQNPTGSPILWSKFLEYPKIRNVLIFQSLQILDPIGLYYLAFYGSKTEKKLIILFKKHTTFNTLPDKSVQDVENVSPVCWS